MKTVRFAGSNIRRPYFSFFCQDVSLEHLEELREQCEALLHSLPLCQAIEEALT